MENENDKLLYMTRLKNLNFKMSSASNDKNFGNYLKMLENRIYTVGGKVLGDEDRIKLEVLRISKVENLSDDYKDILAEIKKIMMLDNWNNPVTICYIKELLLYLQINLKLNITFVSVVDSLYNKEVFKEKNLNDTIKSRELKSELVKRG